MTTVQEIRQLALNAYGLNPRQFAQIEQELEAIETAQTAANNCQRLAARLYDNFVREHGSFIAGKEPAEVIQE